jgi:formylglycine-generating enzyme required for sulfatase activity
MQQFQRFRSDAEFALDVANDPECPANKVSLVSAMQYCRWLSEQEGISESEMCYDARDEIEAADVFLSDECARRTGYRLLSEAEWECVCRAGSKTPWFCGGDQSYLARFAIFAANSGHRTPPVGTLLPNAWGLFDTSGNVAEWCHPLNAQAGYILRGGSFQEPANQLRSAGRYFQSSTGYSFTGFRIARTMSVGQ